jgi:hypothetical protein
MEKEKEAPRIERRKNPRSNVILPIRFRRASQKGKRKDTEPGWLNSHVSNISPEGFCLDLPEGLEPDQIIEFEYYRRGHQVSGKAKIIWKDDSKSVVGCCVLEYDQKEPESLKEAVGEDDNLPDT